MTIQYNIIHQNRTTHIIYDARKINNAMNNGEEMIFQYDENLEVHGNYQSYNIYIQISAIEPRLLTAALSDNPTNSLFSMNNRKNIAYHIVKDINSTHENYQQYLDIFDLLISQNISIAHDEHCNHSIIQRIISQKKYDFLSQLLRNEQGLQKMNMICTSSRIKNIMQFVLKLDPSPNDKCEIIAKLLTLRNAPSTDGMILKHEELAKTFCINAIQRHDISQVKKIMEYCNLNEQNKKDIFIIAQIINPDMYKEIIILDSHLKTIKNLQRAIRSNCQTLLNTSINELEDINLTLTGRKSLFTAIENENDSAIEQLIKKGININAKNERGYTALMLAVDNNDIDTMKMMHKIFKDSPASLEISNCCKETLRYAIKKPKHAMIEILLKMVQKHSQNINENYYNELLIDIVTKNNKPAVNLIIESGASVNFQDENGNTPLIKAASSNKYGNVKLLLDNGANANIANHEGSTPLIAISSNHSQDKDNTIKVLLENGATVNIANHKGLTPLMSVAIHNSLNQDKAIKLLLDHGANIDFQNDNGDTALMHVVQLPHFEQEKAIKLLLDHGANIDFQNDNGDTALIRATQHPHFKQEEALKVLLDHGANINLKNNNGDTALMHVVQHPHFEQGKMLKVLLNHGANVNLKNNNGDTALISATQHPHFKQEEVLKALLDHGANVNLKNNNGDTALISAAQHSHFDQEKRLKALLDHGANVNLKNNNGDTALDILNIHHNPLSIILSNIKNDLQEHSHIADIPPLNEHEAYNSLEDYEFHINGENSSD